MLQIFNLFSSFGNILKMIYLHGKCAVLVEYANIDHAYLAKQYLTGQVFSGNILKMYFSHYEVIFFKSAEEKPADEEYFEIPAKLHRFKLAATNAHIHPPIDTLHISNLRRDSCSFDTLKKLFENIAKIVNFK